MISTQGEVSDWHQEHGIVLMGSWVGPSAGLGFEEGEILAMAWRLLLNLDPTEGRYFC
jgi:hypothetical protein